MKRVKRIGAMVLAASLTMSVVQSSVLAVDAELPNTVQEQLSVQAIAGFVNAGEQIGQVTFAFGQDEAELTAQMPDTLTAYLSSGETVEIPVTWVCLGDYANTDDFYYEFVPQWDMNTYAPAYVMDSMTDVPYVMAQRVDGTVPADDMTRSEQYALSDNVYTIFGFLTQNCGFNAAAACGVLANIECESNFNPNLYGDNGTSYGICQWHNERLTAMKNWCNSNGYDWQTLTGQLNYLKKELSANNSSYLYNGKTISDNMKSYANTASGAYDAGYYWCYYYEVPANRSSVSVTRGNKAKDTYWPQLQNTVTVDPDQTEAGKVYSIFSDVARGAWYCDSIQYVYDNNIMAGISSTKFAPNGTLSRAMAAMILYNLSKADSAHFGLSSTNTMSFTDVPAGAWYTNAVKWAAGAGIVSGYDSSTFGPSDSITREQFAVILYNYAKKLGCNVSSSASLNTFSDGSSVSAYAKTAMQWAVAKKIMSGSDGALRPRASLTRAEAATMIRFFVGVVR